MRFPCTSTTGEILTSDTTELTTQILTGNTVAFRNIVEIYKHRVASIARRFTGNDEDMHDVAQETFLRVHRALGTYDPSKSFDAWIYRITVNTAMDFLRMKKRHRASPLESMPESGITDSNPPADKQLELKEAMTAILITSRKLPERQKKVFILRDLEGLSICETAEILGIGQSTVRVHLSRARERIRKALISSGIYLTHPSFTQGGDDQ